MEGRNRRFLFRCLCAIAIIVHGVFTHNAYADTETINWYVDGETYDTTTCQSGDDIELPTTPTKKGYTFLGWESYIPIEYLKNTGTQYINSAISISSNIKIETKIKTFITGWLFGATEGSQGRYGITTNENGLIAYSKKTSVTDNTYFIVDDVNVIEFDYSTGVTINGHNLPFASQQTFGNVSDKKLFLFFADGSAAYTQSYAIYYFKIYNNNILVRDFVPALDYNCIACMYDKVTETFFYNAGTGDFIAGPVISGE